MNSPRKIALEICIDSVPSAIAAAEGGADRVELCDNLLEGGTTPSAGAIGAARSAIDIGLQVIIRPRGGDFLYSDVEFDVMRRDIAVAKDLGADGVVIGCLNGDGTVDAARTEALIEAARPMNVTFHRAFDMTRDPFEALETLIGLGVDRILTSGQEPSVLEGLDLIRDLHRRADGRVIVMPGAGITLRNLPKIVAQTGVSEVHFYTVAAQESGMAFRNPRVFMGGELRPPEYTRLVAAAGDVAAVRSLLRNAGPAD